MGAFMAGFRSGLWDELLKQVRLSNRWSTLEITPRPIYSYFVIELYFLRLILIMLT